MSSSVSQPTRTNSSTDVAYLPDHIPCAAARFSRFFSDYPTLPSNSRRRQVASSPYNASDHRQPRLLAHSSVGSTRRTKCGENETRMCCNLVTPPRRYASVNIACSKTAAPDVTDMKIGPADPPLPEATSLCEQYESRSPILVCCIPDVRFFRPQLSWKVRELSLRITGFHKASLVLLR